LAKRPLGNERSGVICKNPFCMTIFTVPSRKTPKGTTKVKLTCPVCKREHDYKKEDFHGASGPEGTALNPA